MNIDKVNAFKIIIFIGFIFTCPFSYAMTSDELAKFLSNVCQKPGESGKYLEAHADTDLNGSLNVKLLGSVGANVSADMTKKEWEGVQQVLREEQASDNKDYRQCVQKLFPTMIVFLDHPSTPSPSPSSPSTQPNDKVVPTTPLDSNNTTPEDTQSNIFDVPVGSLKKDIQVNGVWETYKGKTFFKYTQDLFGQPFDAYVTFEKNKATDIKLRLSKLYTSKFNEGKDRPGTERTEGSEKAPEDFCFGSKYTKFINNVISEFGGAKGEAIDNTDDLSSDLTSLAGYCTQYPNSASCSNSRVVRTIKQNFQSDTGVKILTFTATKDTLEQYAAAWEMSSRWIYHSCRWLITMK